MSEVSIFNRKVFIKDLVIMTLIIALPFLFYLYLLVPEDKIWETKLFKIEVKYYYDVNYFVWYLSTKLLIIFLLSLWYISSRYWWKFTLFLPIAFEIYKFFSIINDEYTFFIHTDRFTSFMKVLPASILFIFIVHVISINLNYYNLKERLNIEIAGEIELLLKKTMRLKVKKIYRIKKEFNQQITKKNYTSKEEYLAELYKLRNNLLNNEK